MTKEKLQDNNGEYPFEGILGDTCELRILKFMLPLKDCVYSVQEISEVIESNAREINIAMDRFVKWGVMNKVGHYSYSINSDSEILKIINEFNLCLIGMIIEEQKENIDEYND